MSRLDWHSKRHPSFGSPVAVLRHAQKLKASRMPMVNPYDKFTQPEFDAWIGDMTDSLRRALGFEQDEPRLLEKIRVNDSANNGILEYPQLDLSDQDEIPDDSFAQIKKRRDKGKARDPREGPGLGRDRTQPIGVASSDEEEEEEVEDLAFSLRDDDPDTYNQNDSESDYLWERSSSNDKLSSPPTRIGPPLRSRQRNEAGESFTGTDDDESDEYDDDDGDTVNRGSEVITISSDEEESVNEDEDQNRPGPSSSRHPRDESYEDDEVQGIDGAADEVQPLDDDTSFPPRCSSPRRNLELNDPWKAPRIYAEDFYSGGELRFPAGAHVHPDHLGPLDEDTDAIEEGEDLSRPHEVDHNGETSPNLLSVSEFQQGYYEGNDVASWDELDPRFFSRTEDVDIGIDSFLSSGVFASNQSELRTRLNRTEYPVETGFKYQSGQSLPLPVLTSDVPSKRFDSIPQDAEIITLDDSDGDEEDSMEVIPPLGAVLEMVAEPGKEPEVSEVSQTNYSTPFVPVVEIFDSVGDDEQLSVHTAHTEDIEHESHLQPFEIVEPEDDVEPEDILDAVDTLPLDSRPKPTTVEVDNQTLNYYEDFDDIYETPVSETLPLDLSGEYHLGDANFLADILNGVSQDTEVDKSQDSELAGSATLVFEQFPWFDANGVVPDDSVPDSTKEETSMEISRNDAVDVQTLRRSATPNGLQNKTDSPRAEELLPKSPEFTTKTLTVPLSPSHTSVPGQPRIPMPVMADAAVPDPTESPTRLQEHPILSIPGSPDITVISLKSPQIADEVVPSYPSFPLGPLLHSLNRNADGLFTPADFSTATTPAEDSNVAVLLSEWQEAGVTTSKTAVSDELHAQAELTDDPVAPPLKEVGDIFTQTDITWQKPVLMADPYPYCLSTPYVPVPTSDGSSEENDDDSIRSHSTEKENEDVEVQFTVDDIEPHINCQPVTTESEDFSAPLSEFDLRAMKTGTQNLPEDTTVKELGSPPPLDEKNILVATELQNPTMGLEDSLTGKDPEEQVTSITLEPLEAGVDANLEGNPETPLEKKKETADATIPEDSHLQQTYQENKQEAAEVIPPESRPSKRKRETPSHLDGSDSFSVRSKGKPHAKSRGKQRGKAVEPCLVEELVHDTIYVRTTPVKRQTREPSEIPAHHQKSVEISETDRTPEFNNSQPPHPQFHAPSLFHAHGRTKRQKSRIQPIASVRQTRDHEDQSAPKSSTQHSSALEKPLSQSGPSRNPSPLDDSVLPTTTGATTTEIRRAVQSDACPSIEPSQLSSSVDTPVPSVESPTQEEATTFPRPSSIAPADENSKSTYSITPTTVAFPSLQSSPSRFLQPSSSLSSIRSTRSQCKYHKITLPIGENGRRVCFLVPGCSLTNQELMKEEDIEDLGEAKYEDSLRMIQNVDHLDFDQYLIGILRQLVGLDILREGEIFYLPQPGDDIQRKHWPRKSTGRGSDYTGFVGSPGYSYSGSARSPSTRPPLSNTGSVFTSLSEIATGDDESDNQSPFKGKRITNTSKGDANKEPPYDESTQMTPPKSTKRGVKRTRTLDISTENDGTRKSKRLRRQSTNPSLYQSQQYD